MLKLHGIALAGWLPRCQ